MLVESRDRGKVLSATVALKVNQPRLALQRMCHVRFVSVQQRTVSSANARSQRPGAAPQTSLVLLSCSMRRAAQFVSRRSAQQRCYRRSLHARSDASNPPVQITTLPNGIRVATEASPGHFSGVGLFVDAGSRYETPSTSGVSHFLDRLALKVSSVWHINAAL
jgi:hypothetical protein